MPNEYLFIEKLFYIKQCFMSNKYLATVTVLVILNVMVTAAVILGDAVTAAVILGTAVTTMVILTIHSQGLHKQKTESTSTKSTLHLEH